MQAGILEEMMDDTLEMMDDDDELEEEAEEEVERVLFEITDGKLGVAGAGKELPVRILRDLSPPALTMRCVYPQTLTDPELEARNEREMARMQEQLNSLLSS